MILIYILEKDTVNPKYWPRTTKPVTYKGKNYTFSSDFSTATLYARRKWNNIYDAQEKKLWAKDFISNKTAFQV